MVWRIDTWYAVETVDETFASIHILLIHVTVIILRCVKGRFCYNLAEEWGRETCLTELHYCSAHFRILRYQGTDADAALAVSLRNGVDKDDVLLYALKVTSRDVR